MTDDQTPAQPNVSVIVPVFNDQPGLLRCLDGLCRQTYPAPRVQVIVVDNGSQPAIQVMDAYPFEFRIVPCTIPGSYAARNAGIQQASGDVFAFIDADCIPDERWLAEGVAALEQGGGANFVGGEVRILPPLPRTAIGLYQYIAGFQQQLNVEHRHFSATANLFCFAKQMVETGPFAPDLLSGGDREWSWRAIRGGFSLIYKDSAIVHTPPRTSMRGAIRQARRVAGGRKHLQERGLTHLNPSLLKPHRTGWAAVRWILTHPELTWWERLNVLGAAVAIRCTTAVEGMRLRAGGHGERR